MKLDTAKTLVASMILFVGLSGPALSDDAAPVVVELFTSQGCSSCPPAEAFLNELVDRDDLVTLEYHVDYWDYIGWADPYAESDFTDRQRRYAAKLGSRYVYTPQMVIDGAAHEVGSDRSAVMALIEQSRSLRNNRPAIDIAHTGGSTHSVDLSISGPTLVEPYEIILVTYDSSHETEVKRGENRGKILENRNVVRSMTRLGEWRGGEFVKTVDLGGLAGDGGCAVLVQRAGNGPILAAAKVGF